MRQTLSLLFWIYSQEKDIINGIWVKQTIIFPFFSVNLFSPQQDVMNGIWINWVILVPFFFGHFFPPGPDVMNGIWVNRVIRLFGACQDQQQIHCSWWGGEKLISSPFSTVLLCKWKACGTSHQITLASINMTAKSSHAQHICRILIFFPFERTWRRYHSSQLRVGFVLFKVLNGRKWGDWRGRWPLREPRSTFCKRNIFVASIHSQLMGDDHPQLWWLVVITFFL